MAKILVIDDDVFICKVVTSILKEDGLDVTTIHSGEEAANLMVCEKPDLILLDVVLPKMDGYATCKLLKEDPDTAEIPIIFITSATDLSSIVKGFSAGGIDYIPKPFSPVELSARVKAHLKNKLMTDLLRITNDELAAANEKLETMLEEKRRWAMVDSLTGLYNRHFFMENQSKWWESASLGVPLFIAVLDVDNFKKINDLYGHCAGDYVICTISDHIRLHCKTDDAAIRWGGDEFLMIFSGWEEKALIAEVEQLCRTLSDHRIFYENIEIDCTLTVGITKVDPSKSIEENISKADAALYDGKVLGKNYVVFK